MAYEHLRLGEKRPQRSAIRGVIREFALLPIRERMVPR